MLKLLEKGNKIFVKLPACYLSEKHYSHIHNYVTNETKNDLSCEYEVL